MKRSEAIKLIIEHLYCFRDASYLAAEEQADECLSELEKAGMIPPFNENNTEHASRRDADGYVWEPESE